jgi:hypothetical protein
VHNTYSPPAALLHILHPKPYCLVGPYQTTILKFKKDAHGRFLYSHHKVIGRLCGLVVSVADYKHRGPGFDSWALLTMFLRELGLERDPLSLVIG